MGFSKGEFWKVGIKSVGSVAAKHALALFESDLSSATRTLAPAIYSFGSLFPSLALSERMHQILGRSLAGLLRGRGKTGSISVEIADNKTKYMRVSERDGHVIVDRNYLMKGDSRLLYLDVIHELVHVRQFLRGADLYDDFWEYVDRPIELEAYSVSLNEARRLDISEEEIKDYLKIEWVTEAQFERLLCHLGIVSESAPSPCIGYSLMS